MKDERPYELRIQNLEVGKIYQANTTSLYYYVCKDNVLYANISPTLLYDYDMAASERGSKFREYIEPNILGLNVVERGPVKKTEPMLQGISRRDYFAARAMQGLNSRHHEGYTFGDLVHVAREQADKLIAELDKENKDV
ncbi:MAG: hypothetical protein KAI26_04160 [Nanoarchaeota archaeon]|nr:hypothetical protein [Nanoarchaeota archaeon]